MVRQSRLLVVLMGVWTFSSIGDAQEFPNTDDRTKIFFVSLQIVQGESAEARKLRLEFINAERDRIRSEIQSADKELGDLREMVPDEMKPRMLRPQEEHAREVLQRDFNVNLTKVVFRGNAAEIMRGKPLTNMVLVLGPVANYRKQVVDADKVNSRLPSLSPGEGVTGVEATHYRFAPATTSGGRVEIRLNRRQLEMDWPVITRQVFPSECKTIEKMRDIFETSLLMSTTEPQELADRADALDEAAYRLMTLIYKERKQTVSFRGPQEVDKRVQRHRELTAAIRHLERFRATVNRFKLAPDESRVREFPGGTIEDFIDFCYRNGFAFQEAAPGDEEAYRNLFNKMKAYGRDVQMVNDTKIDILARINELEVADRELVMEGAKNK